MSPARHRALMDDHDACLRVGEIRRGWHFCPDYDGLLINPMGSLCGCALPARAHQRVTQRWHRYYTRKRQLKTRRRGARFFRGILWDLDTASPVE